MANPNAKIDGKVIGRAKGTPNKVTKELKEMILGALDAAGGEKYLTRQAEENPGPFMTLVGKCLPKDINASIDAKGQINVTITRFTEPPTNATPK